MTRGTNERIADVRRLLEVAREVYEDRANLAPALERATGLSPAGVALGFDSLEREASSDELRALVASAGDAAHVHVILSANVFVAPLRALAIARAASTRVSVQPSSRDPVLARALVATLRDPGVTLAVGHDASPASADRIDVYGRDETVAKVRSTARAGVLVRGHGAGLGVAIVTAPASVEDAARALASDVVPFDQRGCLSPRIVFVEGPRACGEVFADALHEALAALARRVPRGDLTTTERADSVRWRDTLAFAGRVQGGPHHVVAFGARLPLAVPPSGRHVLVVSVENLGEVEAALAPIVRFVVPVGAHDPARLLLSGSGARSGSPVVPAYARLARLGEMQRPPLDGPVDRRESV